MAHRSDTSRESTSVTQVARASRSPAPGVTATVAPFRAWRSLQLTVAGTPTRTGRDYRRLAAQIQRDLSLSPEVVVSLDNLR